MQLDRLLDMTKLAWLVDNGFVNKNTHPLLPLDIYNYTHRAQFDGDWNDGVLKHCRGLIVDHDGYIVARPFAKFHNLNTASIPETMMANLPPVAPLITESLTFMPGV